MNKIKLHEKSKKYMDKIFSSYEEIYPDCGEVVTGDNFIIHMYPKQDTYNDDGESIGFFDAIIFDAVIYNPENSIKFKAEFKDAIKISNISHDVRIFKDMSTMINIKSSCSITFSYQIIYVEGATNEK